VPVTGVKNYVAFLGGLNTEAGYLTFPENFWKEGDNVVPDLDGSLSRRPGIDVENLHEWVHPTASEHVVTGNVWKNVGGDGERHIFILQVGPTLYFYKYQGSIKMLKETPDYNPVSLTQAANNPSIWGTAPIKVSSGDGICIITSRDSEPLLLEYDEDNDLITSIPLTLKIRDFEGVDSGLRIDERPTTMFNLHRYNLFNQGWTNTQINTVGSPFPSDAMTWNLAKNPEGEFKRNVLNQIDWGTSPAPKGRYVLNLFDRNRSGVSGISDLPRFIEKYRPTTSCFFAGRAWYSGVKSSYIGNWVLFSQVAINNKSYENCHQEADPTSETVSDLVESDGGNVVIQGCGEIVRLVAQLDGVLVLATNGVWFIFGTSSNGFSATAYQVTKITDFGCISGEGVVVVESNVLYMGYSGIYAITPNPQTNLPVAQSLTDENIKSLILDIPVSRKQQVIAGYSYTDKVATWIYHDGENNKFINFDSRLNSFYTYTTPYPKISSVFTTPPSGVVGEIATLVFADGELVVADGEEVFIVTATSEDTTSIFKYVITRETGEDKETTLADFIQNREAPTRFRDWYGLDFEGVSFDSFVVTGHMLDPNGADKKGQAMYVTTYLKKTESRWELMEETNPSGCFMRARWDFTDSPVANKWNLPQQIYRQTRYIAEMNGEHNTGYPLIVTKNKLRGRGRALQVEFRNDDDKDFSLVGWTTTYIGNDNV
jgi:hypothetical protein